MASTDSLASLSEAISKAGADIYLVPMADEFQGEYIPACAARLPMLTGFTGSAGLGAFWAQPTEVRMHALFVDGRYSIQAAHEVDAARITVINSGITGVAEWLVRMAPSGARVGFDPWLVTQQQLESWKKATAQAEIFWVPLTPNLVDSIWENRPAAPAGAVQIHPLDYAGLSTQEKQAALLAEMQKQRADALVITLPDAINWLLNIRGSDIPFNPLLLGYYVLQANGAATFYVHERMFSEEVAAYFKAQKLDVASIDHVFAGTVQGIAKGARVIMNRDMAQGWFMVAETQGWQVVVVNDPTELPKATKNTVERAGMRAAHRRDGLALSKFLHWFDARVLAGNVPDELGVVAKLEEFRATDNAYRGPSFATIAGSGPHGAIVHYRADAASNRRARTGEMFLLDSGGQYLDGTTDVTRTFYLPLSAREGVVGSGIENATAEHLEMKDRFTRVLKGHIALASATFPAGTSGVQLDVLARQFLWAEGLDYDHGTGHGVGAYLCVHEGPQRVSKRGSAVALVEGMVLSNEPGYYKAGSYGIRIENLVEVVARGVMENGTPMLGFETLTLVPIDVRLVNVMLLNAAERNWLNQYHQHVYKAHAESLDAAARSWLLHATRAI